MSRNALAAVLAFAVAASPVLARAQQPLPPEEQSECTTTTTVHCTGAAARYGAPPAAQPAPVQPAPQYAYPPAGYPPPQYGWAPPPVVLDLRRLEGDDWHLVQHSDGSLWRERKQSTAQPGVWGTGLALLAAGWLAAGGYSLVNTHDGVPGLGFMPVIGAWTQAGITSNWDGNKDGVKAFYAIDGIVQAGGFIMFLVGLASGPDKIEKQPVYVGGAVIPGGAGLSASGHF